MLKHAYFTSVAKTEMSRECHFRYCLSLSGFAAAALESHTRRSPIVPVSDLPAPCGCHGYTSMGTPKTRVKQLNCVNGARAIEEAGNRW